MTKEKLFIGLVVVISAGFFLSRSDFGQEAKENAVKAVAERYSFSTKERVLFEHPSLVTSIAKGGGFGGKFSAMIGQAMFSREADVIEEAKRLTEIEEVAPRTWLIRLPIVNAVLFETDEGLVLVDTGMAPGGPAVLDAMRSVSDKPLHTLIYTHGHVDHAFGAWALIEAGETPEIIAHEGIVPRFERYIRLRGSISKYMDQPLEHLPASRDDIVWPTRTFRDRLELTIGGEQFILQHRLAETDDQFYVWVPGRKALASAEYYLGILPNVGNGKRVQRYPEEWAHALREMVELEPEIILPGHGPALTDRETARENFLLLAEALEFIVDHTIDGLNSGLRKDQIFESVQLPEHLANHPSLEAKYVSAKDISKMVIKRYTGWWDDIPSHWSPSPMEVRAAEIVQLAGGIENLIARANELGDTDIQLACHLADWAFLAEPENPAVQDLVIETYRKRIVDPESKTQEMLAYLNQMVAARGRQLAREAQAKP